MKRKTVTLTLSLFALGVFTAAAFAYTSQQASSGKELYVQRCSLCHGADARGGIVPEKIEGFAGMKVPPLAGPGALPGMANVFEVYEFARTKMPPKAPGSLKDQEYLSIVAFALQANGIQPDNKPLAPGSAKKINLPGGKK